MFISPMLVSGAKDNKPFNSKHCIVELQLDGIRCLIANTDHFAMYTGQKQSIAHKFPELHMCPFPQGTIVDGELIIADTLGNPDYEAMAARLFSARNKAPVVFYAFDIVQYKGIDVTNLPLAKRKELLEEAFEETDHYKKVRSHDGKSASALFQQVQEQNLEGIVIKRLDSKYTSGRRLKTWQKVINWKSIDVIISGYRKKDFSLLAAIHNADGLPIPVGVIEHNVRPEHKKLIETIKHRLVYKEDQHFVYMKPMLMARIKTRNWTRSGRLRSPEFMEFVL
ncbi:ATP-dependent DNA ligase [Paenibacillus aestuarii]|uniref:RNA ligase family protein n=1 Tax=Paenibacillus aestuarii TaxID=516965 RepID=A0ABW0K454_9BACL|nr:RNA ligase family protein [Paenibacillus aestuarii]